MCSAGRARVASCYEGGRESTVGFLIVLIGSEDPASKRGRLVVIASGCRGDGLLARRPRVRQTCLLPRGTSPVLVEVQRKKFASIERHDTLKVVSLGGRVQIVDIEADLAQIESHRVAIGNHAAAQDPSDGRKLDRQASAEPLLSDVFGPEEVNELFPGNGLATGCCQSLTQLAGPSGSPHRQRNLLVADDDREPTEGPDDRDRAVSTGSMPELIPAAAGASAGNELLDDVKPRATSLPV